MLITGTPSASSMSLERPPKSESGEPPRFSLMIPATILGLFIFWLIGAMVFTPFFILIGVLFLLIGLQYVLWGYWFERYFKKHPAETQQDVAESTREHDSRLP